MNELKFASDVAVKDVLGVRKNEKVLIITNPVNDVLKISNALYDSVNDSGAVPVLMIQNVKTQLDFAEPSVIDAIKSKPDIVLSISREKLGKDKYGLKHPYRKKHDHVFDYLLHEKKIRSFWSPGITIDMFEKTIPINYQALRKNCGKLKKLLTKTVSAEIKTEKGTDIKIGLKGRKGGADDGDFTKPGRGGNLPCGEVFISPELGTSNGTIVFDGSISSHKGEIIIKNPIRVDVKNGFVEKIYGEKEAKELIKTLRDAEKKTEQRKLPKSYIKNIRNLGELGIGLNPKARIVGNMLEDEKVLSTCHVAIGANYDNDANAITHLDGLIKKATINLTFKNGEMLVMEDGILKI